MLFAQNLLSCFGHLKSSTNQYIRNNDQDDDKIEYGFELTDPKLLKKSSISIIKNKKIAYESDVRQGMVEQSIIRCYVLVMYL